jgi:hypothetical protein
VAVLVGVPQRFGIREKIALVSLRGEKMQIVFAAAVIIAVFWTVVWLVQKFAARTSRTTDARDVRRTLENGAWTLGGSDFLRSYPPIKSKDETPCP